MVVILIAVTCSGVHSTLSESVALDVSTYGYSVLMLLAVVGLSRLGLVYSVIQSTFVLEMETTWVGLIMLVQLLLELIGQVVSLGITVDLTVVGGIGLLACVTT